MNKITIFPSRYYVAANLRRAILSGEIASGKELSLTQIAAEMNISRTPVREALQMLENDGLITLRINRGAIVNTIDSKFISDHYEIRMLMEGEAAFRAAKNGMDTADLEQAVASVRLSLEKGEFVNYKEVNQRVHTSIWKATDNKRIYSMLISLWNGPSIGQNTSSIDHMRLSTHEHAEILRAIALKEPEKARDSMVRHIQRSMHNILSAFDFSINK